MEDEYKDTCVNFGGSKPEITGDMLSLMLAWAKNDLRGIISENG